MLTSTILFFVTVAALFLSVDSYQTLRKPIYTHSGVRLHSNSILNNGFNIAELFSGPAARYNGELIDKSLKIVERAPKPEGYVYGAVSSDSIAPLLASLVLVVGVGALLPYFLSIGETALKQQREREAADNIASNEFAAKAKKEKNKK